ncbi:MAG: WhiB family transcriptional regulator [Mycobacterium sp.]|nr:MAG: WhiB family transcriptional regulator [Mycobacterium sp.]
MAPGGGRQLDEDLSWQDYAVCNQSDPEAFFPEKGGSTKQAKSVCRRCSVTEECLQYALKYRETYGIWGGKSEQQRREILKEISDMAEAGLGRAG